MLLQNRTTSTFDKKWASYALAGGALLAAPMTAEGSIIIRDLDISLFTEDGVDSAGLDVDGPLVGGTDEHFTFFATASQDGNSTFVATTNPSANNVFGFFAVAKAFQPGQAIGGSTIPKGIFLSDKKNGLKGKWPNTLSESRYVGLSFTSNGNTHFGWAEVSVELGSAALNVHRVAYNDEPGGPISVDAIPEPSTMGLMLLGAAGIAVLKRRRRKA
jgi:hypothetical protein